MAAMTAAATPASRPPPPVTTLRSPSTSHRSHDGAEDRQSVGSQLQPPVEYAGGGTGKIERYSPQERKERIERYRSKRSQRKFQKKITYACRKTLADSRPRIRGRFARSGEGESETDPPELETTTDTTMISFGEDEPMYIEEVDDMISWALLDD